MNTYAVIAGVLAFLASIGHLTIGKKQFLQSMMGAEFDQLAKKVMQSVFHYISVFLFLTAFMLIMPGLRGSQCTIDPTPLFIFIALNYLFFAIAQIIIAIRAKISLLKMFQWIFWVLISVFSYLAGSIGCA